MTKLLSRSAARTEKVRPARRRRLLTLLAVATILQLPQAIPCNGSRTITPTCGKTVVLTKVGPPGPVLGAGAVGFVLYDVNIFARGSNFLPAPACPQPVSVTVDVNLHCDPGPDASGTVGPIAIGSGFTDITVPITIPAGPPRECQVSATATVTFSDGSVVTSVCPASDRGPTVCIVAPVPGAVPRLDIERLTTPVLAVHAGDVGIHSYRIKNNDPAESFSGRLCVGSKNTSKIPEDTSGTGNVFGVSDPAGDAFAVVFADEIPAGVCPPLPKNPHLQIFREAKRVINLAPGQEIFVDVMHRPYGGCATGSCNESRVRLTGEFTDNTRGLACTNAAVVVDNSIPSNIGACPGVGSIGQVVNVVQAQKIADFQVQVAQGLPLGNILPVQTRGFVNGFPGLQVQTNMLREDNNESVRDITIISDPGGNPLPLGGVLEGEFDLQIVDPTFQNEIVLDRVDLATGAPTGLSHLAPAMHLHLHSFPIALGGSPDSLLEGFLQFGVFGFPSGGGNPILLNAPVAPDPFNPRTAAKIELPNDIALDRVEIVCDIRFYGHERDINPPQHFQGNLAVPLGVANVAIDHTRDHLTVSNIGSSGLDGVAIDLGDHAGPDVKWEPQPLLVPGVQMGLQAQGIIFGAAVPQVLGSVQMENPGGGATVELSSDFTPIGAQTTMVQVFGGGRLVGTAILPPAGNLGTLTEVHPNVGMPNVCGGGKFTPGFPYPLPCFFWDFDRPGLFNFPNNGPMVGDRLALFASGSPLRIEGITELGVTGGRLQGSRLTISNIGSSGEDGVAGDLSETDELWRNQLEKAPRDTGSTDVNIFGNRHIPLGAGQVRRLDDRLTVSNIGSSGEDGVSIDIGDTAFIEIGLDPPVNLQAPDTEFRITGTGTVGGVPNHPIGFFGCQNNFGQVVAVADFKAVGLPTVELDLRLGGVPQGVFTVPCGIIGSVTPGPGGGFPQINRVGKIPAAPTPCFFVGTDRPITFDVPGGPILVVDEVRALAPNAPGVLTELNQLQLTGRNLGRLVIGGEDSPAPPTVTSVTPNAGTTGEKVIIRGSGFGSDPDDLCVVVMFPGDPVAIPLVVESCTDDTICAIIGPMPLVVPAGGEIMVARGQGKKEFFKPAFRDIVVVEPVWTWDFTRGETAAGVPFNPVPNPPPPGTVWFEQPFVNGNGQLCLTFEDPANPGQPYLWPDPCKVEINARLRDHSDGFGFDQFASCLRFTNTTTPFDCAQRICDSIRCAWFQQAGILVDCSVTLDINGVPTVCIGFCGRDPPGRLGDVLGGV